MWISLATPGLKDDGSIVDLNGNVISSDDKQKIITDVSSLPIYEKADDIKYALETEKILMLRWATWSGKSTWLPQIAHAMWMDIISTQPRVPAATWLWHRVAQELLCTTWDISYTLGHKVWYRTWQWHSHDGIAPISFHTDGHEIKRLLNSTKYPDIYAFDEYHTKSIPTLFLSYLVKDIIKNTSNNIKIVLSSATIDTLTAMEYWSDITRDMPVIDVPGRTFPIEHVEVSSSEYYSQIMSHYKQNKNILCFESGKREIEQTIAYLEWELWDDATVLALHWEMSIDQQREVINHNVSEKNVIVVATNVAEESITIPYIDVVVDQWLEKAASITKDGIDRIDEVTISQANAKQRAGRAGRVKNGTAVFANYKEIEELKEFPEAPMLQSKLEGEILTFLKMWIDVMSELRKAQEQWKKMFLHDPSIHNVRLWYKHLFKLWAIDKNGITQIGEDILSYPISPKYARMILEAIENGVAQDMIYIVSILEQKWFLENDGSWKDAGFESSLTSDCFSQVYLLKLLISKDFSEKALNFLVQQWVLDGETAGAIIRDPQWGETMLYKYMNEDEIERFWLMPRRLEKIIEMVENIQQRCIQNGIKLEIISNKKTNKELLVQSMVSWSLWDVYKYSEDDAMFYNIAWDETDYGFVKTKWSILNPIHGKYYLGNPFILWWKDGLDDISMLTFLTKIDPSYLDKYSHILNNEFNMNDFNFVRQSELARLQREYRNLLRENAGLFKEFVQKDIQAFCAEDFLDELKSTDNDYYWSLFQKLSVAQQTKSNETPSIIKMPKVWTWRTGVIQYFEEKLSGANNSNELYDSVVSAQPELFDDYKYARTIQQELSLDPNISSERLNDVWNIYSKKWNDAINYLRNVFAHQSKQWVDKKLISLLGNFLNSIELFKVNITSYYNDHCKVLSKQKKLKNIPEVSVKVEKIKSINAQLIEFQKKNQWIRNFMSALENIAEWKEIPLSEIGLWKAMNREESLINDSKINHLGLLKTARECKTFYGKLVHVEIPWVNQKTFRNALINIMNDDNRKYSRAKQTLTRVLSKMEENRWLVVNDTRKLRNLDRQITWLKSYYKKATSIREDINRVNFTNVLYMMNQKWIYTKKFLIWIISKIVLDADSWYSTNASAEEFKQRISQYHLSDLFKWRNLDNFIAWVQNLDVSFDDNSRFKSVVNSVIDRSVVTKLDDNLRNIEQWYQDELNRLWKWDVSELHRWFKDIVTDYFSSDMLESHDLNFIILNYLEKLLTVRGDINKYNNVIRNFCIGNTWSIKSRSSWIDQTAEYRELWENISEYHYCIDQFNLHVKEIKKDMSNENDISKARLYLGQLKELVVKLHRLKDQIHHELDTMKYDWKRTV